MDHLVATYISTLATVTTSLACFVCAGVMAITARSRATLARGFAIAFFLLSGIHTLILSFVFLFHGDMTLAELSRTWYSLALRGAIGASLCGFVMFLFIDIDGVNEDTAADDTPPES